jgi:hypothetical protein
LDFPFKRRNMFVGVLSLDYPHGQIVLTLNATGRDAAR